MAADRVHKLYEAALAADAAFTRELERVYGKRGAGDARYRYSHADTAVNAAAKRKLEADQKLLEAMRYADPEHEEARSVARMKRMREADRRGGHVCEPTGDPDFPECWFCGAPMPNQAPRRGAARRSNPARRSKPLSELTASELERRIANMERRVSEYLGKLIDAGLGHRPHSELVRVRDEAPSSSAGKLIDGYLREWEILRPLLAERLRRRQYHGSLRPIRGNPRSRARARVPARARARAPARPRAPARNQAPAARETMKAYRAKYKNGSELIFRAQSDASALRYAQGLGAARVGCECVSLKETAARAAKKKNNPATSRDVARAIKALEDFTGHDAQRLERFRLPSAKAGFALGLVPEMHYIATRDGETAHYVHKFRARSRPLLVASEDGANLYLLGGAYRITDRGIVDSR